MKEETEMATRAEVYEAIDGERDYQDQRWGSGSCRGQHSTAEFLLFMEDYLAKARRIASTTADMDVAVLDVVRKVTALGVVCMEQNGAPKR